MRWPLLESIPDDEARLVLSQARRRTFGRGEVVFHQGDPADTLHLIASGRLAVKAQTPLGEAVTFTILGPGEFFGELAVLSESETRTATVIALEPTETHSIHRIDIGRLRREHPSVNEALLTAMVNEVARLSSRLVEALYVPAEERIVNRLAELAVIYDSGDGPPVIRLTQDELAELAGTSRATVNRVLKELEGEGTIELRRRQTAILDAEALTPSRGRRRRRESHR